MRKIISPLRQITQELWDNNIKLIDHGHMVLEIGCGNKNYIKTLVEQKGANWTGLDANKSSLASYIGTVNKIPFDSNSFDIVICSQSIEHWYEFGTTFDQGLSEILRVLKSDGLFFVDFPLYLHGHPIFMLGRENYISQLFQTSSWAVQKKEHYFPQTPYYTWNGKRKKYANEWICQKIIKAKRKSSQIMFFLLKKSSSKYDPIHSLARQKVNICFFELLRCYKYFRQHINSLLIRIWKQNK